MQEKNDIQSLFGLIVLDLNMPISDGWEACKNILKKYDDSQMFKIDEKEKLHMSRSKSKKSGESSLLTKIRPLIVACTSEVIDNNLKEKLLNAGFDMMFETPISDAQIQNEILPRL